MNPTNVNKAEANRDPISGAPGAHPVGTGLGAAAGGIAGGAAAGTLAAGPVGTVIGAAVGAVLGGLGGKAIAEQAGHDAREAYSTLNMGAGFALFVKADDAERTAEVARAQGVDAWVAGKVEAGPKQLLIEPIGVRFGDDDLQLR